MSKIYIHLPEKPIDRSITEMRRHLKIRMLIDSIVYPVVCGAAMMIAYYIATMH